MTPRTLPFALATLLLSSAAAGQVSTEKIAEIRAEQAQELKKIADKYGDRKLSAAERRQRGEEENAAQRAVLEKHGVDAKEFTRAEAKLGRADQKKVKERVKQAEQGAAASGGSGGQAQKATGGAGEVTVDVGGAADDDGGDEEGGVVIEMPDGKK